jgi:hypothetical protein
MGQLFTPPHLMVMAFIASVLFGEKKLSEPKSRGSTTVSIAGCHVQRSFTLEFRKIPNK